MVNYERKLLLKYCVEKKIQIERTTMIRENASLKGLEGEFSANNAIMDEIWFKFFTNRPM